MVAQLNDRQKEEIAKRLFLGRNPAIAASYRNDPRTVLANNMMGAGSDMSPAKGGWAEGLSRAASGVAGGLFAKQQRAAYGAKDAEQAAMENAQRLGDPTATGQGGQSAIMGGPPPPPVPPPAPPPPPPRPSIGDPAIAAMAGGGAPPGGPPGIGDPNIAKIAGALGQGAPPGAGGLPPGGLPPPPGPVAGPNMASLSGTPTQPPMGTPPPNPMVAPGSPGAQAGSSPNSLNRVATALTPQPAMEDVGGLQAMPEAPPYLRRREPVRSTVQGFPVAAQAVTSVAPKVPPPVPGAKAEALGWAAPRAERRAALAEGRFGGRDDPYGVYGATYGFGEYGRPDKPIPEKTIGEVIDFGRNVLIPATKAKGIGVNSSGEVVGTSAQGAHQFTASTLEDIAPRVYGDNWRQRKFDPATQDYLAEKLFDERKKGNLKDTWASLPDATPGAYAKKSWAEMKPLIIQGESAGAGTSASGSGTGGGKPGYGPPAAAAVAGSQVNPVGEVPAAPNVDIPDLPPAQPEPVRQALPKQIQSLRLATARNLIRDNPNADPTLVAMASDADWEAGTKEEQSAREKAYDAEVQGIHAEDLSKRQLYNAVEETRQKQPIAERDLAVRQKYDLQGKEYSARTTAAAQEDTQRQETSERLAKELADKDAATALAIANAAKEDANYRNSGAAQKDMEAARTGSQGAQSMLANIQKFRKAQDNAWVGGMQGAPLGIGGVAQGFIGAATGNQAYGEMSEASTDMGVARQQLMKGSTSDSDRTWLLQGLPSRGNSKSQNEGILQGLERTAQRQQEYWTGYSQAIAANGAQGRNDFQDRWNNYINSVSVQPGQKNYVSYEQWMHPEVRR